MNSTTQPQLEDFIDLEEQYQVATFKKFPFVIERGEDVWVYTTDGDRYRDLYGGYAVGSTRHSHPRVVRRTRASLGSSDWLNSVVEWWMTTYARICRADLLNALSIEFEQINGCSSNGS
jgi:acetylornithine/succinyldiaminopimelate/putrescine aminotransferase